MKSHNAACQTNYAKNAFQCAARDAYLRVRGLSPAVLTTSFDDARVRWMEKDAPSWLERHRFYPGIVAWLNRLEDEGQLVYILSTKGKPFLDALLDWQGVRMARERVRTHEDQPADTPG